MHTPEEGHPAALREGVLKPPSLPSVAPSSGLCPGPRDSPFSITATWHGHTDIGRSREDWRVRASGLDASTPPLDPTCWCLMVQCGYSHSGATRQPYSTFCSRPWEVPSRAAVSTPPGGPITCVVSFCQSTLKPPEHQKQGLEIQGCRASSHLTEKAVITDATLRSCPVLTHGTAPAWMPRSGVHVPETLVRSEMVSLPCGLFLKGAGGAPG